MVPGEKPVVLLAEDDDEMRELLCRRLEREGMRVVEAEDGYELRDYLELCRPGGDIAAPDVVVSDVNMPGESGPEALEHSQFLRAPLVLISGYSAAALRALAARLGAVAIFEKPIDLDLLMAALWRALGVDPKPRPSRELSVPWGSG